MSNANGGEKNMGAGIFVHGVEVREGRTTIHVAATQEDAVRYARALVTERRAEEVVLFTDGAFLAREEERRCADIHAMMDAEWEGR